MDIKREQVLFGLTVAVTALLGWNLYNAYNNPVERPNWKKKDREVPPTRVPEWNRFPSPARPGLNESRRDLFAAPRDTRPLPKLQIGPALPPPATDAYELLSPPTVPAPALRYWHRYFRVNATTEKFDFATPESAENATNNSDPNAAPSNAQNSSNAGIAGSANAQNPAAGPAADPAKQAQLDEEALAARYDRLILKEGPPQWGRILNPKKYDIKEDEAIAFQMFDKEGKPFGKPVTRPRAEIISYQLAKTLRNDIEIRRRKIMWAAGNEAKIREFGLWCLSLGGEESFAIEEAERQLRKAAELAPKDPANMLALGKWYETTYRYQDAWKLYVSMTEGEFKASAEAWVARAELELRLHLDKDAATSLERASTLDPNSYHPKLALGEHYLSTGLYNDAIAALDAAFRNEPTGVDSGPARARIRRRLGEAQLAAGNLDAAGDAFDKARNADPTDAPSAIGAASVLWLKKQAQPALDLLNATIAAKPVAGALVVRGIIKIQQKDFAGAKADLESAVGLDPVRDVKPLSALAFLYFVTDHRDEAMAAVERALQNDPGDPYSHYLRGRLKRDAGDIQAANEDQKIAVMADLGFVDPLVELGMLAATEDLYEAADRYYAKAAEFDKKNAGVLALRGLNLLLWGQIRRARESFSAAITLQKDHALARLGLGLCNYLDDNPNGMRTELANVRDGRPDGDRYRKYAVDTLQLIQTHERKEEWSEGFDHTVFSSYWERVPQEGLNVRPVGGEARIDGQFINKGVTGINCNKFRGAEFCSFEATVRIPAPAEKSPENQTDVTAYVRRQEARAGGKQETTLEIAVTREWRKVNGVAPVKVKVINERGGDNSGGTSEIVFDWPEDKPVTIRFEINDDENSPRGSVIVENQIVKSDIRIPRGSAGNLDLGVEASGDSGNTANVSIDNVRVVKRILQ